MHWFFQTACKSLTNSLHLVIIHDLLTTSLCKNKTKKQNAELSITCLFYHSMGQMKREGAVIFSRYYFSTKITLRSLYGKNEISFGMGIPEHFMTIPAPSQYSSVPSLGAWMDQLCLAMLGWDLTPSVHCCPPAGGTTLTDLLLDSMVWGLPNQSQMMSSALAHIESDEVNPDWFCLE